MGWNRYQASGYRTTTQFPQALNFVIDCREFRDRHVGFVDDTLSAVEMDAMLRHLQACPQCSRQDTAVRRGLLLVRNLPRLEASPEFVARLNLRLQELGTLDGQAEISRQYGYSIAVFTSLAAGLALAAYVVLEVSYRHSSVPEIRLAPVIATGPEAPRLPLADPAYVTAITTGMPVWPAVLMADEAPMHLTNAVELQQAVLR